MQIREVEVEYSRTVSDGNYGSERYGVVLSALVNGHEDAEEVVCDLAGQAKEIVVARLKASDSRSVRRGVAPRAPGYEPRPALVDEEDDPERPF